MSPREVKAPTGGYRGKRKVYATARGRTGWDRLCASKPGPMLRCYKALADTPFPPGQQRRHHELKGKLKGFWEYEVTGGDRVRYKRGSDGKTVVVYAGSAPPDTH